jgi:dUTP pyrophosphatase
MGAKFELVSGAPAAASLPVRKTAQSAGYDFVVSEDIIIPSWYQLTDGMPIYFKNYELKEVATYIKDHDLRPTLVSTHVKCKLDPDQYLELSVRSSTPLKYLLLLANGVGIIDADYYNNPDNEGHIYFQLINFSPYNIQLRAGDCIGQGIIRKYEITEDDAAAGERIGGFGSTTKDEIQ